MNGRKELHAQIVSSLARHGHAKRRAVDVAVRVLFAGRGLRNGVRPKGHAADL